MFEFQSFIFSRENPQTFPTPRGERSQGGQRTRRTFLSSPSCAASAARDTPLIFTPLKINRTWIMEVWFRWLSSSQGARILRFQPLIFWDVNPLRIRLCVCVCVSSQSRVDSPIYITVLLLGMGCFGPMESYEFLGEVWITLEIQNTIFLTFFFSGKTALF